MCLLFFLQYLTDKGCHLFAQNAEKLTACDLAVTGHHSDVAQYLESKMVFAVRVIDVFTVI